MFKINTLFALIAAILLVQIYTGGSGVSFDLRKSNAYLHSGNCYLTIGSSYSGGRIGTRFYNQPFGWRQHRNRLYIPNVLRQRGQWSFGLRLSDGQSTANEMFKITINGLQLRISPVYGTGSRNLIIRQDFRSEDSNDDDYQDFLNSLNLEDSWFSGPSDQYWWYPSTTAVQVSRRSSQNYDVDNLVYDDGSLRNSVIFSTTPSLISTTVRTEIQTTSNRAVLDRQVSANRQIEQLNSVIAELTSNVQASSGIVSRSTAQLTKLKGAAGQCNDKILEFSNKKQAALTAVSNLRAQINQARSKLEDFRPALSILIQKRKDLVDERDDIEKSKPSSQTLFKWQAQAAKCDDDVQQIKVEQTRIIRSIDENDNRIDSIRKSTADAPSQITLAKQQLSVVDATIADLENKLANARAQKIKIQSDISTYQQAVRTSKAQISQLQTLNLKLKTQSVSLKSRIDSKIIECDNYDKEVAVIRKQIADKQQDYQELVKKIAVQDNLIANKRNQMSRFQAQISVLPIRLSSLQGDLQSAEIALQRQYQICSQSSDAVIRVESDLRAAQLKFDTQSRFLNEAKTKLTAAFAQKKAADDAVDKYLGEIERYPKANSGSSVSVQISGSVPTSQIVSTKPISIGSIGDYVTRVYGPSVKQYVSPYTVRPSNLYSTMYPVSSTTLNAIYGRSGAGIFLPKGSSYVLPNFNDNSIGSSSFSNVLGDFSCSSSSDFVSGYGKILSVQPGYLVISTSTGSQLPLRVSDCTRMESNKPNFVLSTSDSVFYRGRTSSKNDLHLHDLTCVV